MKALGVDYVRVTVLWRVVAHRHEEAATGARRTSRRPTRKTNWDRYDALVRSGARNGIGIYFNVTGPRAEVGARARRRSRRTQVPRHLEARRRASSASSSRRSARATAATTPTRTRTAPSCPRVALLGDLQRAQPARLADPAVEGQHARTSPVMYRDLWYYGRAALDVTGHKNDIVLIGETAPLGNTHTSTGVADLPEAVHPRVLLRDSSGKLPGTPRRATARR